MKLEFVVAAAAAVLAGVALLADVAVKSLHYLNCHSDFPWF